MTASHTPDTNKADTEALYWVARVNSGEYSNEDHRALQQWLRQSEANRHAYREVSATWDSMEMYKSVVTPEMREARALQKHHRFPFMPAAAAALVLVAFTGGLSLYIPHQESPLAYTSPLREQKDIRLSDGTTIKLNVDSELTVMYSNETRRVRLERGEALFTIAAGDDRAFEVVAANSRVRDIGTRFGVRIHGFTTSVIVTSGTVDVTIEQHDDTHRLVAGEELDYDTEGKVIQARKIDVEASTAWADGLLVLNAATLAEAAEEISRYNDIKILLSDPTLNDFRISGTFDLHATHDILAAIEATLPVTSVQEDDRIILLRRS